MTDPIRPGVADLIKVFHRAGVSTVMITGDQSTTAYAVASQLNLAENGQLRILDSAELTSLDQNALQALAKKVNVYSRVSPAHKLKLVQALQSADRTVAMTGDGINDGPALKASNLGIALGQSGTDVAREVADIILEEDNLEILIKALEEGRTTYSNIRKSVHFFLSTNLTEIQVMFAAMALGIGYPLNVMQLLWINIISDIFPGLALSREKPAADLMASPPRKSGQSLFSADDFKQMLVESSIITGGSLAAYGYGLFRYGAGARAGSLAFQSLTIGQLMHAFSCRSKHKSIFDRQKLPPNPSLSWAVGGSLVLQILTMMVPGLRNFLGVTSLSLLDAAVIGASSVLPFVANEARKLTQTAETEVKE
jgi:Ca2+-transporting ATPase